MLNGSLRHLSRRDGKICSKIPELSTNLKQSVCIIYEHKDVVMISDVHSQFASNWIFLEELLLCHDELVLY